MRTRHRAERFYRIVVTVHTKGKIISDYVFQIGSHLTPTEAYKALQLDMEEILSDITNHELTLARMNRETHSK